jgi:uncharacterized membrane protein (DUF373 family)
VVVVSGAMVRLMSESMVESEKEPIAASGVLKWFIIGIEYAIVMSLLVVAAIVLIRTMVDFISHWSQYPQSVVGVIDGILVVIIVLDIAHTVFEHLQASAFPIRPFLVIGILAGVRDILSASAHLTLGGSLSQINFDHTLIALGVGVGVVIALLLGLLVLRFSSSGPATYE